MTKMRKTLALSGIVAFAAAGLGVAGPAAASEDECLDGYFCMWSGTNFTGEFLMTRSDVSYLGEASTDMNDKITSYKNRTRFTVAMCTDANMEGICYKFGPGGISPNLNVLDDFDNQTSSIDIDAWG